MSESMKDRILAALDLPMTERAIVKFCGADNLPSAFPVTDLAAGTIAAAALAVSELIGLFGDTPTVSVDRRLSSLWFAWSIRPIGWRPPAPWDAIAGDYCAGDGWIRLHTNAPMHRAAALSVLGCGNDHDAVARTVETWSAEALEAAIVAAGGCAAVMRSAQAWSEHPQGRAVAAEPLIALSPATAFEGSDWHPRPDRPLAGLKVLDLTRVLAGPIATRFLAGYGADVLRIDPPGWDEPGIIPEVTLGKRCARLDLRTAGDRAIFEQLLARADILVHGYRPGALDALGYGEAQRQAIRPGLIDVSLDAYGWSGPWKERRGFDSLVQMSAGIAEAGMAWKGSDKPVPLPVQALDHATGYLMAAAAIRALIGRLRGEGGSTARLSLARTASLLSQFQPDRRAPVGSAQAEADYDPAIEETAWGPAQRAIAPATIEGAPMLWNRPASRLGSADPIW
jgi:crotonobetainyl-CoA:carnitine CoA-transferase CaiB-like acyl-CoA transferase